MAVAVEMTFVGATLEMYDEVVRKMGFTPHGSGPPGALFHWVAKTDDGIRVTDVWQTAEQYGQFADEQIRPYAREAGFPGEPEVKITELHNYLTAG